MLNTQHIQDRLVASGDFRTGSNGQIEAAVDTVEIDFVGNRGQPRITFKLGDSIVNQFTFAHVLRDDTCVLRFSRKAFIPVSLSTD